MKESMKHKLSFTDLDELRATIGCYEDVERVFNIEFASAIEKNGSEITVIFASDFLGTEKEDEFLEKYDGKVYQTIFRDKTTKKLYNSKLSNYRFDIVTHENYEDYHYTGMEKFTNPKIIKKR